MKNRTAHEIANELDLGALAVLSSKAVERIREYEKLARHEFDDDLTAGYLAAQDVWVAALGRYEGAIRILVERASWPAPVYNSDDLPF